MRDNFQFSIAPGRVRLRRAVVAFPGIVWLNILNISKQ